MNVAKMLPWAAGTAALLGAGAALLPPSTMRGFDLDGFDRLPVLEGGRVKPLDSIARNSLLLIRSQQSFRHEGRAVKADEWLLDALFRPEVSEGQPAFFINDPEVLGLIGLAQTADRYFSLRTIWPHIEEIERQAQAAQRVDSKLRTRFQGAVANLYERILLYHRLRNTIQIAGGASLADEIKARSDPAAQERQRPLASLAYFRPLPLGKSGDWRSVGEALRAPGEIDPGLEPLSRVAASWKAQDAAGFNRAVADLRAIVALPEAAAQADHEELFNRAQPFYAGMVIYLLALLALFVSWLWKPALFRETAFALLAAGAIVHTAGLISRVVLQGRPPVTNLYSSAVFVGWGAVIIGVILERMYRRGFGTAVAAASGFASLIIAHHLARDGDTMEMMRAVLDSNFWLATHVVTITIGYSGTYLAGALGIGYALRRHFGSGLDPETGKTLTSMAYGVICFSLFFSFVGTVLGGIWADQSWGRFWGWDPKENGALLIVLWNAIILHARWGGYAREKGVMAMAVFGNVITSLSWFGVNMLGVGLHSYGFMNGAFWALSGVIAAHLVFGALCLLPAKFWSGGPVPADAAR